VLEELLSRSESKTLEFKENAHALSKIVQTVIAFANTAGETLVIGIQDKTKNIIGIQNILQDEERIANAIADSVTPTLLPNLQFISWREKDVLILTVPHSLGPFYLKDKGETGGVYVRLGSTNRIADSAMIAEIKRLKEHISFDQLPDLRASPDDLDLHLANQLLSSVGKSCSKSNARSLELVADYHEHTYPTKGGLLLFGKRRDELFPDPFIRLIRFEGVTKSSAIEFCLTLIMNGIFCSIRKRNHCVPMNSRSARSTSILLIPRRSTTRFRRPILSSTHELPSRFSTTQNSGMPIPL